MTAIEHQSIKGITLKLIVITLFSTVSITASVLGTYFSLREDVKGVQATQETTNRVNEIRLKLVESQVSLLQQQIHELQQAHK